MSNESPLAAEQCRAARALIGWSRSELSAHSGVAASTLADFEGGKRTPYARTLADVRQALEIAGVLFIPAGVEGGAGVRLSVGSTE